MKSLINNDKQCFICGSIHNIHKHHIYYGTANRKLSEKYGCWIYLCAEHHNGSDMGIHFNKPMDEAIKKHCQRLFQEHYKDLDFIKIFGKNYL